ncbi:ABC transporter substrate-binding protein [Marinilactibacillus psychrotolerans]|uniref:ABC transporter substrate-binding protein n=1 Tax=Marinilactibacillus psychrotolerans TaxID=191770 RepID=UPI001865B091|nr:ABC transporter substrate-binding protein [Marinilactibacillus psychrotolerans]
MSNWKTRFKFGATIFASTVVLAACGDSAVPGPDDAAGGAEGESSVPQAKEGDTSTLMVGLTNAPDSFNPFYAPGISGKWIQRFMYDSLLVMPEADSWDSVLASSFETEDNQTFTIEIDPNANWTDGEPVKADDVAFTLNAIADPQIESSLGTRIAMIEGTDESGVLEEGAESLSGVEVTGDKSLTIKTKTPVDIALMKEFVGFDVLIAPQHIFGEMEPTEIANSEAATQPSVFSGPYKFVEYDNDNYVQLEANEDYYRGAPKIETIYGRIMNGTAMVTEFQAGNLHMAAGGGIGMVPIQDISLLEDIEGLEVKENPSFNGQYMIINNDKFPDPEVRKAFIHAIDRQLTVDNLLEGRGEVLSSMYTSASPYHSDEIEPLAYDPDQAKQMLEDAGFDFNQTLKFGVPTGNAVREQNGNLIQQALTDIGVKVDQQNYDFPTWLQTAQDLDYDIGLMGYGHTVDPNVSTYIQTGATSNNSAIADPVIDDLLAKGNEGTSVDERFPIYEELQQYMQDQAIIVPLYSDSQFSVQVDNLNGGINEYWAGSLYNVHEWTLDPQE